MPLESAGEIFVGGRSRSSVWRYSGEGIDGNVLWSTKIAGRRMTTREAVERFIEQTGEAAGTTPHLPLGTRRRIEAARQAMQRLQARGFWKRNKKAAGRGPNQRPSSASTLQGEAENHEAS